jgi:ATP-dependent exoDNAse (exonuclease V) beta subunit
MFLPGDLPMPTLTGEQSLAVARREGSLLLAAAAGSGKTSVLVERFIAAAREDGIAPNRILAITFTDRAAGELKQRIRARMRELGDRELARDTETAFVSTFHSFCARMLRTHPLAAGVVPGFTIIDRAWSLRMQRRAFRAALSKLLREHGEQAVDLVAAYGADPLQRLVLDVHAQLRSRGAREPRLPAPALALGQSDAELDRAGAQACELIDELLADFGSRYAKLQQARGGLDFDELELRAKAVLEEHNDIRAAWSERFELMMIDEFQDTNARQLAILSALERENLFTVGDEMQAIYGFRDADVEIFRSRSDALAPREEVLRLSGNFRSRPALIAAVNAVYKTRMGADHLPLVAVREEAEVQPPQRVELLLTDTAGVAAETWRAAEAQLVAARIAVLVEEGETAPGEVAVLLRATTDIAVYERALRERGLDTVASAGRFWDGPQVSDLIAYLGVLANPLDEVALVSALASPLAGLSSDGLVQLVRAARAAGVELWEALSSHEEVLAGAMGEEDRVRTERFGSRLRAARADAGRPEISAQLVRELAASGYELYVLAHRDGRQRLANVRKLLRLVRRFEQAEGPDLRGFLDHVAEIRGEGAGVEPEAGLAGELVDAVRLMSVHAAKGLEFGVVCVADLGRLPTGAAPALLVDGERIGLSMASMDGSRPCPTLAYGALLEERRAAEADEEDRVFYVAMTRARERLLLSGSLDLESPHGPRRNGAPVGWIAPALLGEAYAAALEGTSANYPIAGHEGGFEVRCEVARPRLAATGVAARGRAMEGTGVASGGPARAEQVRTPTSAPGPAIGPVQAQGAVLAHTLSYTALGELERCGYRFYLERVLGLPQRSVHGRDATGEIDARERGVLVHSVLEHTDLARPRVEVALVGARAAALGILVSGAECERIALAVTAACAGPLMERVRRAPWLRREHPFAFTLQGHSALVTGVIDLLATMPDGSALIVDYKSDAVAAHDDLEARVRSAYRSQRLIYALAALRGGAQAVEVVHWFLERPEEPAAAHYGAGETATLEVQLRESIAGLEGVGYAVSEEPHRGRCHGCPGQGTLCSWPIAMTERELSIGSR